MDKILIIINKIVITVLCKDKNNYTIEIKQGDENYLLVNNIKGDVIYCSEWGGTKYRKECELNISELSKFNLEITQNKDSGNVVFKGVKSFLLQNVKTIISVFMSNCFALLNKVKIIISRINFNKLKTILSSMDIEQFKSDCYRLYKSYKKSRYNERLNVLRFAVDKSFNETLREFDFETANTELKEFISSDRLRMILDYFVESGDLTKDKYSEIYIINGKALQTLDRLKQTEQLINLNLYLRIVAALLLLILIF